MGAKTYETDSSHVPMLSKPRPVTGVIRATANAVTDIQASKRANEPGGDLIGHPWTYLTTPFLFAMSAFAVEEIKPWQEQKELWRGLRVTFPSDIASHSRRQDFYFGRDFLLRRHDYNVEASGGFAAAQYVSAPVTVQGITLATKRRAYMRDQDLLPIHDRLMVSIDISDVSFS